MLSVVACAAGYVWLAASSMHAEEGVWRGCLFKQFFHIPCPMWFYTGSHSTLSRALKESLLLNPNGVLLAVLMLLVPGWILLDIIKERFFFVFIYGLDGFLSENASSLFSFSCIN